MDAHSLKIPGASVRFALGLNWRHESERPKGQRLKELAADRGRWGLVRKTASGSFQVGFVAPIAGVDKALLLVSLADAVAEAHSAPWRGVFQLSDDRYWYIAVGEGYAILPDGDCVCSGEEKDALLERHAGHGSWREVGGGIEELSELVVGFKARTYLKDFAPGIGNVMPFKSRRSKLVLGSLLMVVVAGAAVAALVQHQATVRQQEADTAKRRQALAELRAVPAVVAEKPEPRPWAEAPEVHVLVAACHDDWSGQALEVRGWVLQAWQCTAGATGVEITTKWHRDGGLAHDAPGVLDASGELAFDTRSDAVEWGLNDATTAPQLPGGINVSRASWTLAQRFGIALQVDATPQVAPAVPGSKDEKPRPKWAARKETWTLPFAPWLGFAPAFEALGELRIESVGVDLTTDAWTVVSNVYVKA